MKQITKNTLFYGDNLSILREYIPDESVDLVYLDPPFNSNRSYNVLFRDESGEDAQAQITAFEDTWHWGSETEETYYEIIQNAAPNVASMINALRGFIGTNQMMAYLVMMTARLIELYRVLKPTGSIYLHCDPTASHYLKIVMDTVFGVENFRSEVVWKRTSAHSDAKTMGNTHDIIFFYTKSKDFIWNKQYQPYSQEYIKSHYRRTDIKGRQYRTDNLTAMGLSGGGYTYDWNGVTKIWRCPIETMQKHHDSGRLHYTKSGSVEYIRYLDEMPGISLQDLWDDIPPINSRAKERLGYPTQKPLALLERIIKASSNKGDVILDPFCGCGTAVIAAEKLGRKWIGIDVTHLSISLMKYRLKDNFKLEEKKDYEVIGEPESLASARHLAQKDRFQFEWWALSLVKAKPQGSKGGKRGKKGADKGIDGVINFVGNAKGKMDSVLVQVKSGHVKAGDIRDLRGVVERENAALGLFITLEKPSKNMLSEAVSAGFYESKLWQKKYPRIQILTIEEIFDGKEIDMPSAYGTFKQAQKIRRVAEEQASFDINV